ncbi:MAG: PKD domain-containing protein, partial [Burkholderiales bacterium]
MNDIAGLDPVSRAWTTYDAQANCPGNTSFARPNGSDESGVAYDAVNDRLWIYQGGRGYTCATPQAVGRIAGAGTTSTAIIDPTLTSETDDHYRDFLVRISSGARVRVSSYIAATKTLTLESPLAVSAGTAYDLYADFGDGTWSYNFSTGAYTKLMSRYWGYTGVVPDFRRSMGFASDGTRAVLFGGEDFRNELHWLNFATGAYELKIPRGLSTSPPARGQIENQFAYDSANARFVLFGGRCFEPARCTYQGKLDDTWVYNPATNAWLNASSAVRPPARDQAQMFFDSLNNVIVLYGGIAADGSTLNDLWTFNVGSLTWTQQTMPSTNPGGRFLALSGFAPTTNCGVVAWGNTSGTALTSTIWEVCLRTPNVAPTASFTATPTSTTAGQSVILNGSASSDSDGSIVSYRWDFGDGTIFPAVGVTNASPTTSKSYAAAGTYTITLTVTDNGGATASTTRQVTVSPANVPPTASFTTTPSSTTVGQSVSLNAGASVDTDGSIVNYQWDFGDGTSFPAVGVTNASPTTSKSYAAAGTYTITLTVTDNGGATTSTTRQVTVNVPGNVPPTASFTSTPSSTTVGVSVSLDAGASVDSDGSIVNYRWDFGDGTSFPAVGATNASPTTSKSYAAPGSYTITLTVTDNSGATANTTRQVAVSAPSSGGTETAWLEDALPSGASTGGNEPWTWVTANPAPYSGTHAHQSTLAAGMHQHH